jgi:hypothetical protein
MECRIGEERKGKERDIAYRSHILLVDFDFFSVTSNFTVSVRRVQYDWDFIKLRKHLVILFSLPLDESCM